MTVAEMVRQTCRLDPTRDYNIELINDKIWVFFHASWSSQDWIRDFLFIPKNLGANSYGHMGYTFEALDIEDSLEKDLKGYKDITFVGYSRGAAVALILAPLFDVKKVYVLGCSRVFWKLNPVMFSDIDVTEVIYGNDLVTYLPPFMPRIKWNTTKKIESKSKGWFKSIKDHGMYLDVEEEV